MKTSCKNENHDWAGVLILGIMYAQECRKCGRYLVEPDVLSNLIAALPERDSVKNVSRYLFLRDNLKVHQGSKDIYVENGGTDRAWEFEASLFLEKGWDSDAPDEATFIDNLIDASIKRSQA